METGANDGLLHVLTSDPETDGQTYFFKVFYLLHIDQMFLTCILLLFLPLIHKFDKPSRFFLLFAERYLSNNKSDPAHNPSFKSCLIRIPGSYNLKCCQKTMVLQIHQLRSKSYSNETATALRLTHYYINSIFGLQERR
jgi:hypothetical protein